MSPQIALLICTIFVIGALFLDGRRTSTVSSAIWIPLIWVAILASRPVLTWFQPTTGLETNLDDGSAIDRSILSLLILLAAGILIRRKLQWRRWIKENAWIVAFFLFCGISVLWSDYPVIALKRWIRAIGSVLIILVVVSEKDPVAAIATVVRRCAIVLVPMSIVLIKYYRDFGVEYSIWTGAEYLVGVTTDKNALGRLCLVSGIFATWELFTAREDRHIHADTLNRILGVSILAITLWLLRASDSATSLASFLVAVFTLILLSLSKVRRLAKYFGPLIVLGGPLVIALGIWLDLPEVFITSLGRDMTLTERTFIWDDLLKADINPVIGVGYDSFWLGDRLEYFVRMYQVNSAHNGYLEIYLQLGFVGLFLFAGMLISVFRKATRMLQTDATYGTLRLTVLIIFLIYNLTEAGANATTFIFFVLLLVGIEVPVTLKARHSRTGLTTRVLAESEQTV